MAQIIKNLPAMQETQEKRLISGSGRSLGEGNGNPLQYSCLGNSMTEEPGGLQSISIGSQRVRHDTASYTQYTCSLKITPCKTTNHKGESCSFIME